MTRILGIDIGASGAIALLKNSANSAFGSTSERPYTLRKRVRGDPGLPITTN